MKRTLIRLGLSVLVTSALFGCGGGGSDGINGPTVTVPVNVSNAQNVGSNMTSATSASVALWRALEPKITVTSVTIASPPVVSFAVTDAAGNAVVGLGNKSQSSTATVAALTNLRFTLAKLVPATASEPSKWVSYLVVRPPTVAEKASTAQSGYTVTAGRESSFSCNVDKTWCGTYPTTDSEGTLVDNGDGTYKYTFARDITQLATVVAGLTDYVPAPGAPAAVATPKLKTDLGDVSFNPGLTHRLGIQISGAAPGTGSNVPNAVTVIPGVNIAIPTNATYDFVPNGGAVTSTRNVVDKASCDSCHNGKGLAHGQGRNDPNYCVTCHTDQVKYGLGGEATLNGLTLSGSTNVLGGRAIGNFPNFAHKIHMGSELTLSPYNYLGMNFKEVEWIQDPRNCTKCHNGNAQTDVNQAIQTKDGNNWNTKPSRLACGACHDNVDFAANTITRTTSVVGELDVVPHSDAGMTDDSRCASCHTAATIPVSHAAAVTTPNNPTVVAGISTISYDIKSVTVDATTRQPKITFRIVKDGTPVTTFATPLPAATTASTSSVAKGAVVVPSSFEPFPGFKGGPTFYVAYAVPQDGVASPADFNAYHSVSLANLLVASGSPKAGSLTGPDASGYFVATLTGDLTGQPTGACTSIPSSVLSGNCVNPSAIVVPTTAKMVTGAMIGTFTQLTFAGTEKAALTAKYPSGLVIKSPLKKLVATGSTARRVVVDTNKCESCHEQLGTAVDFHGGARNDPTSCAICHNPNRTSSAWSANASTFVHGIHAGTDPASVTAATAINKTAPAPATPASYAIVGNPGPGLGGAGLNYSSGKRYVPFSWHRDSTGWNAAAMVYPGILKRCENCHVPNAVNFGATGAALLPNLLWSTTGTGKYNAATDAVKALPRDPVTGLVTYVNANNTYSYGNVFSYTPVGSVVASYTPSTGGVAGTATSPVLAVAPDSAKPFDGIFIAASPETLVESPVTAACFACHDSGVAKAHMNQYGGVMGGASIPWSKGTRLASTVGGVLTNTETCLVCHGMGRDQDAAAVHNK